MWGDVVDGEIYRIDGMGIMPNFPFWLFFVAIAVNIYFIFCLQISKEAKKTTS
jgi:type III secretory pathway component EscV